MGYTEYFTMLLNGDLIKAVNSIMENRMGYMWYVMVLTAPIVMVYIKTESMTFAATLLFWTIALFGKIMFPDMITNTLFTVFILCGFAVLAFKVFSPVK